MKSTWLVALLVTAALAGCADEEPVPEEPEIDSESMDSETPPPVFGPHSGLPLERAADWLPTLESPPEWVLGEWWQVKAASGFNGVEYDVTRIVAGKEGPDYLVGMPLDAFDDEIMVLHHPGMGLVRADTLGYETHDFMFELVHFPLEVGKTWDSLWQSANGVVTHTVESIDEDAGTATITMTGQQSATYTYDANLGVVSSFNAPGYMSWEVVDHGFDWEGTVRVPHGHDMHIFHGRLGPVVPVVQSQGLVQQLTGTTPPADVAPPTETFVVPEGYDRASFSIIIVDLPAFIGPTVTGQAMPVAPGAYQVSGTAPDGTQFEATHLPTDGPVTIKTYAVDNPGGEWSLQTVAAGAGQAFIEGVTYVTFDVVLPEGCVILTENVHDHGGECGGHVHDIE